MTVSVHTIVRLSLILSCLMSVVVGSFSSTRAFAAQQVQPWLGVELDAKSDGITIKRVIPGAPAERVGFTPGDTITAIDAEKVKSRDELMAVLRAKGVGTKVTVHFKRKNKDETKELKLEMLPDMLDFAKAQLLGKPAPAFELASVMDKARFKNEDLKGKVYILEFWATWCPACRAASPYLSEWAKAHPDIPIIGISDEEVAVIKAYATREKVSYPQTQDPGNKVQVAYGMSSIPAFILIDQKGVVNDLTVGVGDYLEALLKKAEKLAKAKS